ncbi:unnamed protein product [Candidula unifasciata]|uniref:C-type lectin domain-containing protein n=1 Tax=Candidula unifasciata TaxID=100452 RepID=A0A8S3ZWY3_9EUPU|nr:unnamed protein product [Candidula unifasciata]
MKKVVETSKVIFWRRYSYRSFGLVNNPSLGPRRLGGSWTSPSQISCASKCMDKYSTCWSFLYNSTTGLCTPSSSFDSQQQLPTVAEGDLYNSLTCTLNGFQMYTQNLTTICVSEGFYADYVEADKRCRKFGGVLMSVKTYDRIGILLAAFSASESWVGCDDLDNDGIFRWKEDNEALSEDEISLLFLGKPTKQCISYDSSERKLTSSDCSYYLNYFCEMPLP